MNWFTSFVAVFSMMAGSAFATPSLDIEEFGESLGGWEARDGKAVDYSHSEIAYRSYKPVVTGTPGGGIYISLRVDYLRGSFSKNDHALLQVTLGPGGELVSLESSIHSQGKSVNSDVILTTGESAAKMLAKDPILNAGLKLMKDLTGKMSGKSSSEPGRVLYPAVIMHNFNKLMAAVRVDAPVAVVVGE